MLARLVSERNFYRGSEGFTSRLYQTYPDRSQTLSDVLSQEDLRAQLRKMEAGASDKDKVEAPNKVKTISWTCVRCAAFSIAQASARDNTKQDLSCAFPRYV